MDQAEAQLAYSEDYPVARTSRSDGSTEYVRMELAVEKISGYYNLGPAAIRLDLESGASFQTMGFIYRIPPFTDVDKRPGTY